MQLGNNHLDFQYQYLMIVLTRAALGLSIEAQNESVNACRKALSLLPTLPFRPNEAYNGIAW
jgi:hypothetical protein